MNQFKKPLATKSKHQLLTTVISTQLWAKLIRIVAWSRGSRRCLSLEWEIIMEPTPPISTLSTKPTFKILILINHLRETDQFWRIKDSIIHIWLPLTTDIISTVTLMISIIKKCRDKAKNVVWALLDKQKPAQMFIIVHSQAAENQKQFQFGIRWLYVIRISIRLSSRFPNSKESNSKRWWGSFLKSKCKVRALSSRRKNKCPQALKKD